MSEKLKKFIDKNIPIIDSEMNRIVQSLQMPKSLKDAMLYSINAGGKRIRPLLVLSVLEDLNATSKDALKVASAIELVHTYSLIHDDLPCMDDDDFRRGKPTNHKVFGEATAVLAGDAMLTLSFQLMASLDNTSPEKAVRLAKLLADAAGATGMVGGQILDMEGETTRLNLEQLENVHMHKTGALLSFSIEAGAILADADEDVFGYLKEYAKHIGLAFQIKDDILDVTSTTEALGKTANSDASSHKSTYPALLGLEGAEQQLLKYHDLSIKNLSFLKKEQPLLELFANYIMGRLA